MDTSEQIDRSFGDGPEHRPVADRIAAGRRIVLRRRLATGAGAAATALVVGGTAWAVGAGSTSPSNPEHGPATASVIEEPPDKGDEVNRGNGSQGYLGESELATYLPSGRLVIRKGWQVSERVPNPLGLKPPAKSVGLELTNGAKTYWYLVEIRGDAGAGTSDPAGKGFSTLDAWVDDQVALQNGDRPETPVEFRDDTAELVAVDGATIIRQRANPDVPGFARPGDSTAVAQVRWNGEEYFVLARKPGGAAADYFPTSVDVPPHPTMTSFLAHARKQYGSGEGLR